MLDSPGSSEARRIIDQLRSAGFVAYLAGGCVRDALLGKQPKDYDVATDATPQAVRELFGAKQTVSFGASFGVIGVLPPRIGGSVGQSIEPTEVATFRSDGEYSDGRRPDSVHYGEAREDALRRDFTVNGLFYDTHQHDVIDYVHGQRDIQSRTLRTIGNPHQRFGEDRLRMLRAVRFSTTLGFQIEPETLKAVGAHASEIVAVSGERIGAEMRRVLAHRDAVNGLLQLADTGLDQRVLPELATADLSRLAAMIGSIEIPEFSLSLACLVSVTSEPQAALRQIGQRWRLSNQETRQADAANRHWQTIANAAQLPWSVVQPVLIDRDAETIVGFATAVVAADDADDQGVRLARAALNQPARDLNPPPLLTGTDLTDLGLQAGPQFRAILQAIRAAQLDKQIVSKEQAMRMAQTLADR